MAGDILASYYIRRQIKESKLKNHDTAIDVGFIAQMPEVWDKQMDLFSFMLNDDRFNPFVIYVNHYDFINKNISTEKNNKQFYLDLYGEKRVIEIDEEHKIEDFDYVFYDRPYNQYLPKELKSYNVMKFTKVCLINYCTCDWDEPLGYKNFARNIYLWFASSSVEKEKHDNEYQKKPYNRAYDVGYPIIERYSKMTVSEKANRILWTPRWSYDKKAGGSHFLEYIKCFIKLKDDNPNITFTIRPHPLMFDNLISENLLTHEDVANIKKECKNKGINFDLNRNIENTLCETDILISDYSSILRLFLATGKPIIYCPCDIPLNEEFLKFVDVMYVANNWSDITFFVKKLLSGDDCLYEQRKKCINDKLINKKNVVNSIADIIYNDYVSL